MRRGEILGLVGESGSGKTMTGFSITGLLDPPGRIVGGSVAARRRGAGRRRSQAACGGFAARRIAMGLPGPD